MMMNYLYIKNKWIKYTQHMSNNLKQNKKKELKSFRNDLHQLKQLYI